MPSRRSVSYQDYDNLLSDAEKLTRGDVNTVGNWSFAQILEHLSAALNSSIDGVPFSVPFPIRIMGKLFMKSKLLNKTLPPGFKIPKAAAARFQPDGAVSIQDAIDHLRHAVERCKTEPSRASHPLLGQLTREEWDQFNLRHAELHMSFVLPEKSA